MLLICHRKIAQFILYIIFFLQNFSVYVWFVVSLTIILNIDVLKNITLSSIVWNFHLVFLRKILFSCCWMKEKLCFSLLNFYYEKKIYCIEIVCNLIYSNIDILLEIKYFFFYFVLKYKKNLKSILEIFIDNWGLCIFQWNTLNRVRII